MFSHKNWLLSSIFIGAATFSTSSHAMLDNNFISTLFIESLYTWWFMPDRTMPTLDKLNVVSFLPIESCSHENIISEDKVGRDGIIQALKKKTGILEINGKLYKICHEIPEKINAFNEQPVNLYLGGSSNASQPHAFSVYKALKEGTMYGPCIVFECAANTRRAFNFCQEQDLHCIDLVYQDLLEKYPQAAIILRGGCKGAATYLRFLAEKAEHGEYLENVKACIANYPPISLKDALKDIRYGGALGHFLCCFALPNYNPNAKTILHAEAFPNHIPILISCLPKGYDRISDLDDMLRIKNHLESLNAHLEFFVSKGKDSNGTKLGHGKLGRAPDYQEKVKAFLKDNGLL